METINMNTVQTGDKLHTRGGDVYVVWEGKHGLEAAGFTIGEWAKNGKTDKYVPDAYDIIRIEKKPGPVVEVFYACPSDLLDTIESAESSRIDNEPIYKITLTDDMPSIEKVGE